MKSKSEIEHQCQFCNQYYYPFQVDYNNYREGKILGFNCFTKIEIK